jgi:hypothetical protein
VQKQGEKIFSNRIRIESFHEISNNCIRVVKLPHPKM